MSDGEAVSDPVSLMGHRRATWQKLWCRQPFETAFWINGLVAIRAGAAEQVQGLGPTTGDMVRRVVRGMPAKPT